MYSQQNQKNLSRYIFLFYNSVYLFCLEKPRRTFLLLSKFMSCFKKNLNKILIRKTEKEYILFDENLSYTILFLENISCMEKEQLVLRFCIFLQEIRNLNNPCNKHGKLGKGQYFIFQEKIFNFWSKKKAPLLKRERETIYFAVNYCCMSF